MLTSSAVATIGAVVVLATIAFTIRAMYLGGGRAAVRRQAPVLAALAVGLVALVIGMPIMISVLGDLAWAIVLVALNAVVVGAWLYQAQRADGPLVDGRRRAALRPPAFRTLVTVWAAALAVGAALVLMTGRAGI